MIEKNLKQISEKDSELFDAITEVKLITDKDSMDDMHFLTNAFPQSAKTVYLQKSAENNKIKEKYGEGIYTEAQVKKLCMNYRLRFLPSTYFKGDIPIEIIHKLKEVTKQEHFKYLNSSSSHIYGNALYVMAPVQMFNIQSNRDKARSENERMKEFKRIKAADPALFIKVEENRYLFVTEWGNSFSFVRRILGMLTAKLKTLNRLFFLAWILFTVLTSIGVKLLTEQCRFPIHQDFGLFILNGVIAVGFVVIGLLFIISWSLSAENGFFMARFKAYDKNWWKVNKFYATENNWNDR